MTIELLLRERVRLTRCSTTTANAASGVGRGKGMAARSRTQRLARESAGSVATSKYWTRAGSRVQRSGQDYRVWARNEMMFSGAVFRSLKLRPAGLRFGTLIGVF